MVLGGVPAGAVRIFREQWWADCLVRSESTVVIRNTSGDWRESLEWPEAHQGGQLLCWKDCAYQRLARTISTGYIGQDLIASPISQYR